MIDQDRILSLGCQLTSCWLLRLVGVLYLILQVVFILIEVHKSSGAKHPDHVNDVADALKWFVVIFFYLRDYLSFCN